MKNKGFLYVLTNDDVLELPQIVTDTLDEMSKLSGIPFFILYRHCLSNRPIMKMYRIRKVDIRDPEEKFSFDDYDKFCKDYSLPMTNFKSLQLFRSYCYD